MLIKKKFFCFKNIISLYRELSIKILEKILEILSFISTNNQFLTKSMYTTIQYLQL
jgi:hypothetical protein